MQLHLAIVDRGRRHHRGRYRSCDSRTRRRFRQALLMVSGFMLALAMCVLFLGVLTR